MEGVRDLSADFLLNLAFSDISDRANIILVVFTVFMRRKGSIL